MSAATRRATKQKETPSVAPLDFSRPRKTNGIDYAFGPSRIADYLPAHDSLPEEFQRERSPWCDFVQTWFFSGAKNAVLKPRTGIDRGEALGHLNTCMRSWEPKHKHKIRGVAYLCSIWFEPEPGMRVPLANDGEVKT